jgi:endo-1,4-beta-xylanase
MSVEKMLSRRQTILGSAGLLGAAGLPDYDLSAKAADARHGVPYGSCVNTEPLRSDSVYRAALAAYCQQVTPEGGLFWLDLRPNSTQFNFDSADVVLAFAEANDITMRGHSLVWYGAMPDWTKEISSAGEAERELRNHIETVVSRYRGKIKTWHVLNEPIDDPKGGRAELRQLVWSRYLGTEYIDLAFRLAHQIDPNAELLVNEYDIECVGDDYTLRRQALLTLVRELLDRGVPLHGVGLQGHIQGKYEIDEHGLSSFVSEIQSLGLSVHVTELDVIDDELPASAPLRDAIVAKRAHNFLNAICSVTRPAMIGTWGITDRYTWMPMWFKRKDGLANRPLPFDDQYRPKPLWSVIDYFCGRFA